MTPREEFKVGVLLQCAERGLDVEQTLSHIEKCATIIDSVRNTLTWPLTFARDTIQNMGPTALLAGTAIPIGAGLTAGWGLAKATEPEVDVEEIKARELLNEYSRLTEQAKRRQAMSSLSQILAGV